MTIFKRNENKETVALWKKEAKRLEKERNQLFAELENIKDYKEKYELLIEEASQLRDKYNKIIKEAESIGDEYKNKLQELSKK